jgi:hypothetical protein
LINLLGWMFRVLARNIHPNVVILGPVSDAEVADPDARGCPPHDPGNTRIGVMRRLITPILVFAGHSTIGLFEVVELARHGPGAYCARRVGVARLNAAGDHHERRGHRRA